MRHVTLLTLLTLASCSPVKSTTDASNSDQDGASGEVDSGGSGGPDATVVDAADDGCGSGQICLPSTPPGWTGPIAIGSSGTCPAPYDFSEDVHSGLNAPAATCSCDCSVGSVDCQLLAEGNLFNPTGQCKSPPVNDACLTVRANASCQTSPSFNVPAATWSTTATLCDGATAGDSCDQGSCYARGGTAPLCIMRDGDHSCPTASGYSERTLYHRDMNDSRACSACGCSTTGQACEMDLEICSVGFYDITLATGDPQHCLSSGDGDGVTINGERTTATGSCSTSGGTATGSATPTSPVTVCCRP